MSVAEVVDAISDASIASPNASSASPAPWARLASRYSASASPTRSPSARATTRAWSANWRDAPGSLSRHAAASSSSCRTRTDVDFSSAELACESADTDRSRLPAGSPAPVCGAAPYPGPLHVSDRVVGVASWRARPSPRSCRSPPWCRSGWSTMVILWLPLRLVWDIPFWVLPVDLAGARHAVVRPPGAGRGADAAARCHGDPTPASSTSSGRCGPRWRPATTSSRTTSSCGSCRRTSSTRSRAAATSSSSRRSRSMA